MDERAAQPFPIRTGIEHGGRDAASYLTRMAVVAGVKCSRGRPSWPWDRYCHGCAFLFAIEEDQKAQARCVLVQREQGFRFPFSLLSNNIGKVPEQPCMIALAIPPVDPIWTGTARGWSGEHKNAISKHSEITDAHSFAQGETIEMGIGGRVAKDAVHRDRQHGGATALKSGPTKSSENTPMPYRNSFDR
jgi:hypothetical protein